MKKSLFVFSILLAFGFLSNFVTAQLVIGGNTMNVRNATGCTILAQASALNLNCDDVCQSAIVTINPFTSVAIPWACPSIDALAGGFFTKVGIRDIAAGVGAKVGNGCGVTLTASYVDCQNVNRTVTFVAPNTVLVQ
jgi:hypothetical protein